MSFCPDEQLPKLLVNSEVKNRFGGGAQRFTGLLHTAVIHFGGIAFFLGVVWGGRGGGGGALSLYSGFAHVPEFYLCLRLAPAR